MFGYEYGRTQRTVGYEEEARRHPFDYGRTTEVGPSWVERKRKPADPGVALVALSVLFVVAAVVVAAGGDLSVSAGPGFSSHHPFAPWGSRTCRWDKVCRDIGWGQQQCRYEKVCGW